MKISRESRETERSICQELKDGSDFESHMDDSLPLIKYKTEKNKQTKWSVETSGKSSSDKVISITQLFLILLGYLSR